MTFAAHNNSRARGGALFPPGAPTPPPPLAGAPLPPSPEQDEAPVLQAGGGPRAGSPWGCAGRGLAGDTGTWLAAGPALPEPEPCATSRALQHLTKDSPSSVTAGRALAWLAQGSPGHPRPREAPAPLAGHVAFGLGAKSSTLAGSTLGLLAHSRVCSFSRAQSRGWGHPCIASGQCAPAHCFVWHPIAQGIPRPRTSHVPQYPTASHSPGHPIAHGIPHPTASQSLQHPTSHRIPHPTAS